MKNSYKEIISKLSKCHDEIKKHPFRITFEEKYIGDYKHLLYHLTEIWGDLIWRCDELSEFEKHRFRMFGEWIHDYRGALRTWDKSTFPMHYFDYYEQMLQVTHNFISTGNYSTFYNLDCYFTKNGRYTKSTRYEWITEEDCGFKSEILPRYFPIGGTFTTDDNAAKKYFSTDWFTTRSQQEADADFDYWLKNTKPVLEWLNRRRKNDETIVLWKCMIVSPSKCKEAESEDTE